MAGDGSSVGGSSPPGGRPDEQPEGERPPERLVGGRYRLLRHIGRGGMAVVWQGRDEILHRDVAVKEVLPPSDLSPGLRDEIRKRAMREARAAARLTHPSVVTIYDVVEDGGRPWIVMALLPARTLADVLATSGPLTPAAAARLGLELLDALRTAHAAGVLHRDVKPSNVMIADDGRAVLTDFGIATVEEDPSITATGMLVGSPGYMAPERARGERPAPASDLWSLGATLYAATEGDAPFRREGQLATLHAVISQEPPPAVHAGPLQPIIARLLDRDPASRPGADEAYDELRRIAAGLPGGMAGGQPGGMAGGQPGGMAGASAAGLAGGLSQAPTEVIGAQAVTPTRSLPLGAGPSGGPDLVPTSPPRALRDARPYGPPPAPARPAGDAPASRSSGVSVFAAFAALVMIAAAVVTFLLVKLGSGGGAVTPPATTSAPAPARATASAPATRTAPPTTATTTTARTSSASPAQTSPSPGVTTSPPPSDSTAASAPPSNTPPGTPSTTPGNGGGSPTATSTG